MTFDFNRLSVLLLRCVDVDGMMSAQKIATATMTGACIHATAGMVVSRLNWDCEIIIFFFYCFNSNNL